MKRLVDYNACLPPLYLPAYNDYDHRVMVCYLFPINFIVRWARSIWFRLFRACEVRIGCREGYKDGYADAEAKIKEVLLR